MKRLGTMVAVAVLSFSLPAFAAETHTQDSQRDECLVKAHGCATRAKTINEQVAALETEIRKGTKVYTPEEIEKLSARLKDLENTLSSLLSR